MKLETGDPEERLHRFEHQTAMPMLVLSVLFVPVLIVPMLYDLDPAKSYIFTNLDHLIWLCFLIEYVTRFSLARDRIHFVARNLADLAIVAIPLLRPMRVVSSLRVLRLLQASRVVLAGIRGGKLGDTMVNRHSVAAMSFVITSMIITGAAMVYDVERTAPGSRIHSVGDAFWWAIATVSTVGYGDLYPVTTEGRVIAGCLMFLGICTSALIAAAFASIFIKDRNEEEFDPKLEELAHRLDKIDNLLIRLESTVESHEQKALEREVVGAHNERAHNDATL